MAGVAIPVRRTGEVRDFSDDELVDQGLMAAEDVEFDHDPVPGERIVNEQNIGGIPGASLTGTMTGTDPSEVAIYDIDGRRFAMSYDWAVMRLLKRYPKNHPSYPNQPVFYKRPPKIFPVATIPCPSEWHGGCRKMLHTKLQQSRHFRLRHHEEWDAKQEQNKMDLEERGIVAQERTAALMERLLTGGQFSPAAIETTLAQVPAVDDPEPVEPEDESDLFGVPEASWKRQSLIAWLKQNNIAPPDGWIRMSQADVWAFVKDKIGA
jgi:hypothetical protein